MFRHRILIYALIKWDNYTWIVYFALHVFIFIFGILYSSLFSNLPTRNVHGFLC